MGKLNDKAIITQRHERVLARDDRMYYYNTSGECLKYDSLSEQTQISVLLIDTVEGYVVRIYSVHDHKEHFWVDKKDIYYTQIEEKAYQYFLVFTKNFNIKEISGEKCLLDIQ